MTEFLDQFDENVLKLFALQEANLGGETKVIEGVEFRLASPEIDRTLWEPTSRIGVYWRKWEVGPPLVFPWTPAPDREAEARRPGCIVVEAGDQLLIGGVKEFDRPSPFEGLDHESHRSELCALVEVRRADGASEYSPWPWVFVRRDSVIDRALEGDFRDAYYGLEARLGRYIGVDYVQPEEFADRGLPSGVTWPDIHALPLTIRCAISAFAKTDPEECAAVAFGYLMGRAEAEGGLLPTAQARIKHRNRMREVGSKGRDANAERGERNRQTVRREVEALVSKNGDYASLPELIGAVAGRLDEGLSEPTIRRALKAFEQDGLVKFTASAVSAPSAKRASRK